MDGETVYRNRWKVLGALVAAVFLLVLTVVIFSGDGGETSKVFVNRSAYVSQTGSGETSINISDFSGDAETQEKESGSYVYDKGRYMTEFSYLGIYRGDVFTKVKKRGGENRMVMTDDFDPYDGTLNSYMTARVSEINGSDMVQTNIYVDRDFREFSDGELFIAWGEDWENYRPFRFKEVAPNVFMDKVYDSDTSRLVHGSEMSDANFAVGTFSQEQVREKDTDIRAAVFMK